MITPKLKARFSDRVSDLETENLKISYEAALEGMVLLKNDDTLPITPCRIALLGAGAGMTIRGGSGSGEVNNRHSVSILEGLEAAGFTVTTQEWIDGYWKLYEASEAVYGKQFRRSLLKLRPSTIMNILNLPFRYPFDPEVMEAVLDTSICIYVVSRQAGEGSDRRLEANDYSLTETEWKNIAFCASSYEKMIVVINVGGCFDLQFLDEIEGINAVVLIGQPGGMGGSAFADLITGKAIPSGKLTDTWPYRYEDIPFSDSYSYLNGNLEEEYYREGIYVGYRYFDTFQKKVRYPFGYGLSYTEFAVQCTEVRLSSAAEIDSAGNAEYAMCSTDAYGAAENSRIFDKNKVFLHVCVKNIGKKFPGKETVQVYVSPPKGGMMKEYQRLAAFAKTGVLKPGESEEVTLCFHLRDLASYRERDAVTVLEAGDYVIRVGNSSRKTGIAAVLRLREEMILSYHEHICPVKGKLEELTPAGKRQTDRADESRSETGHVPVIEIQAEHFTPIRYVYNDLQVKHSSRTEQILAALSLKEKVKLCTGAGMFGAPSHFQVPGAAGYTTSGLEDKGIFSAAMADGPAGLRLQKTFTVSSHGKIRGVEPNISFLKHLPKWMLRFVLGDPKREQVYYQFATAFPVGIVLAQTWNTELVRRVGEAVSREMSAYGVSFWLAPAMNIHRNPLCGRNFEYYSEDPLLTGKIAATLTTGVQSRRGNFAVVKHFACNNQEENRNQMNANVSERALREIYLRGFEITVREACPGAVMSSYNRVNGIYASNNSDLLTKVLRCEWQYPNFVMTDWFAAGKNRADAGTALRAGNDLIMPGSKAVQKATLKELRHGKLAKKDMEKCAGNVLEAVLETQQHIIY